MPPSRPLLLALLLACSGKGSDDQDGDGYLSDVDCDDAVATINPGATETCNGLDDDCDSDIDEEATDAVTWFLDADGDGYGAGAPVGIACQGEAGTSAESGDCDDEDSAVHPYAFEYVDGLDNNCDDVKDWLDANYSDRVYTQTHGAAIYPSALGDLDGDGAHEIALGLPEAPAVWVVPGVADARGEIDVEEVAVFALTGAAGSELGASVAGPGDMDGDGLPELVVGSPGDVTEGVDAGAAWILLGDRGLSGEVEATPGDGLVHLLATEEYARLGAEVSALGDVDDDGLADAALSGYDVDRGFKTGLIWLVLGDAALSDLELSDLETRYETTTELDDPPLLSEAGDVDGDGRSDFLFSQTHGAGLEQWAALVLGDSVSEGRHSYEDADAFFADAHTVGGPGDADGDGYADLLFGDRTYDDFGGAAWLILGASDPDPAPDLDEASATYLSSTEDQQVGTGLGGAGDLDGDGGTEPMVGAQGDGSHGDYTGAIFVFLGAEQSAGSFSVNDAIVRIAGKDEYNYLGRSLGSGDVNGDAASDLLFASYDPNAAGEAYVVLGGIAP